MVQVLDFELGRLFRRVHWDDTTVIFLGDNGSPATAKTPPFTNGFKGELYQGGVSVPMIVRGPATSAGDEVHELVQVSDLFATAAQLAGADIPATIGGLDSVSFAPLLSSGYGPAQPRGFVYSEIFEPNFVPVNGAPPPGYVAQYHDRTIRNDKFKLIERITPTGATYELYQMFDPALERTPQDPALTPDPHELVDLMPSAGSWPPVVQAGFEALAGELLANYPPLPVN
jgi:arylsulfatase A-like enzyme